MTSSASDVSVPIRHANRFLESKAILLDGPTSRYTDVQL